ncbi:MAG: DUF4342 domain-containing protein [Eubacteriales bacterium]|jgi:Sec-independent protein translocase protein TatA
MNRKYTLEDVEYIRARANVTYDEVIGLLDAYEGDVVRVMAELERSGKLRAKHSTEKSFWESLKSLLRKGYVNRMIVRREDKTIANFSIIFMLIAVIFAFYVTIPALIVAIILGYKISFKKEPDAVKDFSNIVYSAKKTAEAVKNEITEEDKDEQTSEPAQSPSQETNPKQYARPNQDGDIIIE